MTKGKTVLGLCCITCALIVSALAAQSASAETTAFTCAKTTEQKTWSDAHCTNEVGTKEYGHVTIPANTTTDTTGGPGTSKPVQRLKATINGISTEITTENITGSGSLHNAIVSEKMQVTGTGTVTFANAKVTAPAGKGCKVYTDTAGKEKGEEGVIHSNLLKVTTTEEMGLKTEPAEGETFATFIMDGCEGSEALKGLNKTYTVTGSVIGTPNGGEGIFEHASTTTQNTLKLNGAKLGIDGSGTLKGKHHGLEETEYKAIAVTTPEGGGGYKEDK